jgi:hypothetical protein
MCERSQFRLCCLLPLCNAFYAVVHGRLGLDYCAHGFSYTLHSCVVHKLGLFAVRAKDKQERDDWFAALSAPTVINPLSPVSSILICALDAVRGHLSACNGHTCGFMVCLV